MRNLNKPPRYNVASIQAQQTLGGDVMQADENGQYVEWRDYAWLLAEVERLRASSFVTAVPSEEYENLKAEVERLNALVESNLNSSKVAMGKADAVLHERDSLNAEVERLRKAGDEVAQRYLTAYQIDLRNGPYTPQSIVDWNAAKEGKPQS